MWCAFEANDTKMDELVLWKNSVERMPEIIVNLWYDFQLIFDNFDAVGAKQYIPKGTRFTFAYDYASYFIFSNMNNMS